MKYLKAFIAGVALPSLILPIGLLALKSVGKQEILTLPAIHFLPLIWGLWNVLYFLLLRPLLYVFGLESRLYFTGALLGFLVALAGIFWLHIPEELGIPPYLEYLLLIALPIVYALLWRSLVKPLNDIVGLHD
jgi:apolipoprotein N-acyltransferase